MGRHQGYSATDLSCVLKALREGATFKNACQAAGCSASGVRELMDRDPKFKTRIERARCRARTTVENALFLSATAPDEHGRRDTRAAELWLTNQDPESWQKQRRDTIDHFFHDEREIKDRQQELSEETQTRLRGMARDELLRDPEDSVH